MFQTTLLNNNRSAYVPWKGKTFGQITSSIQKNDTIVTDKNTELFFKSTPLKIYRRETNTATQKSNSTKQSTSIDVINRPGSSLVVFDETDCDCVGTKQTLDTNLVNKSLPAENSAGIFQVGKNQPLILYFVVHSFFIFQYFIYNQYNCH